MTFLLTGLLLATVGCRTPRERSVPDGPVVGYTWIVDYDDQGYTYAETGGAYTTRELASRALETHLHGHFDHNPWPRVVAVHGPSLVKG